MTRNKKTGTIARNLNRNDQQQKISRSIINDLHSKPCQNKFYIGLAKNGQPYNFVAFRSKKGCFRIEPRLAQSDEMQEQLETAGLDVMDYDERWGRYRIRLLPGDMKKQSAVITKLLTQAFSGVMEF